MKNMNKPNKEKFCNNSESESIELSLSERIMYVSNRRRKIVNMCTDCDDQNYI